MRTGLVAATLAVVVSVAAIPSPQVAPETLKLSLSLDGVLDGVLDETTKLVKDIINGVAEGLPAEAFKTEYSHTPITLDEAKRIFENYTCSDSPRADPEHLHATKRQGGCANLRVRVEWDRMDDNGRQAWMDAVKCLMSKPPSGQWPAAHSRYEDLVSLHQFVTPNVHGNAKFLPWHRAFLHLFENMLRNECGFTGAMPWFDEARYPGRWAQSSIFTSKWLGGIAYGGNCVTDGQFANSVIYIGPGTSNVVHCLSRNGDAYWTKQINQEFFNVCNNYNDFNGMASCIYGGYHASGHNGVGGPMADVSCSPADTIFWLHHSLVDRNWRHWQNTHGDWSNRINGVDVNGNALTLDTVLSMAGMGPDLRIRDILDTTGPTLCYKYDY